MSVIQSANMKGHLLLSISTPVIWTNGEVVELQMVQMLNDLKQNLATLILILAGVTLTCDDPYYDFKHCTWPNCDTAD